jgi:branched-chain amino acid transport system permease protein
VAATSTGPAVTSSGLRTAGIAVIGVGLAYFLLDRLLPSHLPLGVVVLGLVAGGVQAMTAMGIVLIYRSARIFNFAQAAIGGLGATIAIVLVAGDSWSYYAAVPVGLAVAVGTGWVIDATVVRRFERSPRLIFTVVTIGLAELLGAAELGIPHLFSNLTSVASFSTPFNFHFTISPIVFSGNDLISVLAIPIALAGLYWFFQRTDTGVAVRAAADSPERSLLLGIPVRRLSRITWMAAAGLSGVGAILAAPILGTNVGTTQAASPETLIVPLAAAVLGRMDSLPSTVAWALGLGVVEEGVYWSFNSYTYGYVAVFLVLVLGLLFQRRQSARAEGGGFGEFVAVREVRPASKAVANLWEIRAARAVGLIVLLVLGVLVIPALAPVAWMPNLDSVAIFGIIAVSLVALTGWAGQISLCQYAFVGIGASTTGTLLASFHVEFFVAMAGGVVVCAAMACLIGIPALRISGMYLGVVTLSFAVVVEVWMNTTYFPWLPASINRPTLFDRFDLQTSPRDFYELCLVCVIGAAYLAYNFRRSRAGRTVVAVRENPRGAAAYGISPFVSKLLAFGFSGALAGVAGSLIVVAQAGIGGSGGFPSDISLSVFSMAVIGGLGSISGGLLGAVYVESLSALSSAWQLLATGGGMLVILVLFPEGLGSLVFRARDWAFERIAHRRGISDLSGAEPVYTARGPRVGNSTAHMAALRLGALEDLEVRTRRVGPGEGAAADAGPAGGRPAIIGISGVDASLGDTQILFDVSLGVAQGEIVALLGTNGAGKSTTLRTVAGLVHPQHGTVTYLGKDITDWAPAERVKGGLVTVLGGRSIFRTLTVDENLRIGGWVARHYQHDPEFVRSATERVLDLFPLLRARRSQRADLLSGGEQQMLALAQALLCRPKLLMIDELSLGLAPSVVNDLLRVVRALALGGMTVVVVEQSVNVATAISNRAVFMERGRVRFSGPTPDLSQQPKLLRSVFLHAADRAKKRRGVPGGGKQLSGVDLLTGATASSPASSEHATADDVLALLSSESSIPAHPLPAPAVQGPQDTVRAPGMEAVDAILSGVAPGLVAPPPPLMVPTPAEIYATTHAKVNAQAAPAGPMSAFAVTGISKQYGGVAALSEVNLQVRPGEILGVIGSNGAGKTTLFDICSGFAYPDAGRITMLGEDITALSPARRAQRGLGRVFQDAQLFPSMTVVEAIATALDQQVPVRDPVAGALGLFCAAESEAVVASRVEDLLFEMGLERFRDRFVGELSTGTRRVVELACAVAHEPKVLLLDEPTAGIAQRESEALGELLLGLRDQTGAAFIVIEHDVPLVSSIADRLLCMHVGTVIAEGDTPSVLNDPTVVAAYLGADALVPPRSDGVAGTSGQGVFEALTGASGHGQRP